MTITSIKPNKNSPVLQQTLKILPSGPNSLSISGFINRKLLKSCGGSCIVVIWECGDLFYTVYLLNFPTNRSHFFYLELVPKFSATFPSRLIFEILYTEHTLLTGMSYSTHVVVGPIGWPRNALPGARVSWRKSCRRQLTCCWHGTCQFRSTA